MNCWARWRPAAVLTGLLLLPLPTAAQAPVITPEGDPSVRNDTIYALAVNPADYPEDTAVLLLDDGVLRIERDGSGTLTYRMVVQLLHPDEVEVWAEHTFSFDAEREELVLNWARVLDLNGNVISAEPIHQQILDRPVPEQSPVYTSHKLLRISLGGVAPGTIVDYSYTTRRKRPVLERDFVSGWSITTGRPTLRSRLVLDVPEGFEPRIKERNLDFEPVVQVVEGRVVRSWARSDIAKPEPQLFAADSNGVTMSVSAVGPVAWTDIALWYAALAKDRYQPAPLFAARLAELTRDAGSRADSLQSVYNWVAQEVRYVSISLGIGGYQPRMPADVLATTSGDCKDKATLFVALARALGYEAYPVLVSLNGSPDRDLPSISQFDHMIAAVRLDDRWLFADLTATLIPMGGVLPGVAGEFGLLVRDDGSHEEISFPPLVPGENRALTRLTGTLDADGTFAGWYGSEISGYWQYQLRSAFAQNFTQRERRELANGIATQVFASATADSMEAFDGLDLRAAPQLRVRLTADAVLSPAANGFVFMLPLPNYASPQLVAQLNRESERIYPFDVAQVFGPREQIFELEVELPPGWSADLPAGITAASPFGEYESSYRLEGRRLLVRRAMRGFEGVRPPSEKATLVAWLQELGRDDVRFLLLHPPAGATH
ncbi:MAG TPA: DUF3857 and transglutaminase domain-containing protein [Longimicrobiales bacterium]|nr:DUF3857 and transglutaminase domain-containing protein [Longimicrobiales bacterium]